MPAFRIRVPASTSNLGPGFDTLGLALQLYLQATVQTDAKDGLQVRLQGEGADALPQDRENPMVRWAREVAGDRIDSISLQVTNDIPVARGLGSSAAACAAGLSIGYMLRDGRLPAKQLLFEEVARREGHPDNAAPAIWGGFRISGKHAQGEPYSRPGVFTENKCKLLLVIPGVALSTAQSRAVVPKTLSLMDTVANLQSLATLLTGLAMADWSTVRAGCRDELHEPYRLDLVPGLQAALQALRSHPDCSGAFLSGAGPTLVAFVPLALDPQAMAANSINALHQNGIAAVAQIASVATEGLRYTLF